MLLLSVHSLNFKASEGINLDKLFGEIAKVELADRPVIQPFGQSSRLLTDRDTSRSFRSLPLSLQDNSIKALSTRQSVLPERPARLAEPVPETLIPRPIDRKSVV